MPNQDAPPQFGGRVEVEWRGAGVLRGTEESGCGVYVYGGRGLDGRHVFVGGLGELRLGDDEIVALREVRVDA